METYAELLALRNKAPEMFGSEVQVAMNCSQNNWTAGRSIQLTSTSSSRAIRLCVNPNTDTDITVDIPDNMIPIISSPGTDISAGRTIKLAAGAFVVMTNDSTLSVDNIDDDSDAETVAIFDISGRQVPLDGKLAPGIYIKVNSKGHARRIAIR